MCNSLGYTGGEVSAFPASPGHWLFPIWLDEVDCEGDEPNLFYCDHDGLGSNDCDHDEDVGVICDAESLTD